MGHVRLELQFAHLGWRDTPKRHTNREMLQKLIAEILKNHELSQKLSR
jgi:hypothetical protein